jgi:hypothetical protein
VEVSHLLEATAGSASRSMTGVIEFMLMAAKRPSADLGRRMRSRKTVPSFLALHRKPLCPVFSRMAANTGAQRVGPRWIGTMECEVGGTLRSKRLRCLTRILRAWLPRELQAARGRSCGR